MYSAIEISQATGLTVAEVETAGRVLARLMSAFRVPLGEAAKMTLPRESIVDLRSTLWRVRLRIFDTFDVLQADSEDESDQEATGSTVLRGMNAVWDWAADCVETFQPGLNRTALIAAMQARSATARVAVSRGNGRGRFTVPYAVSGQMYILRFDLTRENDPA